MKIYSILFSLLLLNISILKGQDCFGPCLHRDLIASTKVEVYSKILQNKELINEDSLYLVDIQPIDLNIDFFSGTYFFINEIKEENDTISVKRLKEKFPVNLYHINNELSFEKYNEQRQQIESSYNRFKETSLRHIPRYTYIRIFEPLDRWRNLYLWLSHLENGAPYEIIPVLYVRMDGYEEVEKKYMIYEVRFSKEGKIESVKVVN